MFIFVKFLESNQSFFINIEVVDIDGLLYWCNDIILVSTLMKNSCFTQRNLTKMTMHQFLKIKTKLRLKKLKNQLEIFERKNEQKS